MSDTHIVAAIVWGFVAWLLVGSVVTLLWIGVNETVRRRRQRAAPYQGINFADFYLDDVEDVAAPRREQETS